MSSVAKLQTATFETVRVDSCGEIIDRQLAKAEYLTVSLNETIALDLVSIPGGTLMMGDDRHHPDEQPVHQVTVRSFLMGKYPITQAQYRSIMGATAGSGLSADYPIESVSWDEANQFCSKLSQQTGDLYTLPSEAQWEYACRAGTTTPFHFGETIDAELANYDANNLYGRGRKGKPKNKTTVVGTFPANDFGLYDMHGNLWEWCADDWHSNYEEAPIDGTIWNASNDSGSDPDSDTRKVLLGGSWLNDPRMCRSVFRFNHAAGARNLYIGFRVVSCVPRTLRSP